jgi:hypothetical protein
MYFNNLFNNFFPFRNSYSFRPQSAQQTHYEDDIRSINIIQKILSERTNYFCFDCGRQINELNYFDLKNAIFLCYNCAIQHQKYPKEISEVVTGNLKALNQSYLMSLYYGGNKNLIDFIRSNYPLLEKKGRKNIYTTKALDYYRKLIYAKINNFREPCKPRILDGYNSIYSEKSNYNEQILNESSNDKMKIEPADICNENSENDVEMEDENISCNTNESDENTSQDSENESKNKNEKINKKTIKKKKLNLNLKKENKERVEIKKKKELSERCFTLNQLGNINMYPDAKFIDDMDC